MRGPAVMPFGPAAGARAERARRGGQRGPCSEGAGRPRGAATGAVPLALTPVPARTAVAGVPTGAALATVRTIPVAVGALALRAVSPRAIAVAGRAAGGAVARGAIPVAVGALAVRAVSPRAIAVAGRAARAATVATGTVARGTTAAGAAGRTARLAHR